MEVLNDIVVHQSHRSRGSSIAAVLLLLTSALVSAIPPALASATYSQRLMDEPSIVHLLPRSHANKKDTKRESTEASFIATSPTELVSTLVQTHTSERVAIDEWGPSPERFNALLADRVTGSSREMDPQLLELLRTLAALYPGARFELVSGYRSPKLNEMLRKKGHHVATHSQHSLGHAVDFRIVPAWSSGAISPQTLERQLRTLGWKGGIGVYTSRGDWFVHADVGKQRRWNG